MDINLREKILIHRDFLDICVSDRFMVDIADCIYPSREFKADVIRSFWNDFVVSFPHKTDSKTLNFYIHIPYCLDKCSYCHYGSQKLNKKKELDDYIIYLIKYFQYFEDIFKNTIFNNLYIGGGTPNILSERQLDFLLSQLFTRFKFNKEGEKTLEGDPRCSSFNKLKLLKKHGFNRVSFGVQSFNKKALKYSNRIDQNDAVVKRAVSDAKKAGFVYINIDMILGLCGDDGSLFMNSFKKAIDLKPYSISIYPLQITDHYLQSYFNSDKKIFFRWRKRIIDSVLDKMLKSAMDRGYSFPSYPEIFLPMTNSAALNFLNSKVRPMEKTYVVDDINEINSCFGIGRYSTSKINGRSFSYQMRDSLEMNPEDYVYAGSVYNKKIEMAEYITRTLCHRRFISRGDFKKMFGVDFLNEFKEALKELKKLKKIFIRGDKLYFISKDDRERKESVLFFYDIKDIKFRVEEKSGRRIIIKSEKNTSIVEKQKMAIDQKITKKTVIVAGYSCNNNCIFCINWDKRNKISDKSFSQIKKEMTGARLRGATYLEIIGGETSIRPDIIDLVKFARILGFETIMMATNGRMYAYNEFAKKILEAGLNSLVFSIHGHNAKIHDFLTQTPGSFNQLKKGLRNIKNLTKELGLKIHLGSNTCIVRQNYKYLSQIGENIKRDGIDNAEFIFVDPNYGAAFRFFKKLVPKISEAAPYIHKCLDIGKKEKFPHWHIRYVPLCYFQDYINQVSELQEAKTFHTEHIAPDFYNPNASEGRKNIGRIKTKKCENCQLFDKCEGIWREYFKHCGDEELKPINISN